MHSDLATLTLDELFDLNQSLSAEIAKRQEEERRSVLDQLHNTAARYNLSIQEFLALDKPTSPEPSDIRPPVTTNRPENIDTGTTPPEAASQAFTITRNGMILLKEKHRMHLDVTKEQHILYIPNPDGSVLMAKAPEDSPQYPAHYDGARCHPVSRDYKVTVPSAIRKILRLSRGDYVPYAFTPEGILLKPASVVEHDDATGG